MNDYTWNRFVMLLIAVMNMIDINNIKEKEEQFKAAKKELNAIYKYLTLGETEK